MINLLLGRFVSTLIDLFIENNIIYIWLAYKFLFLGWSYNIPFDNKIKIRNVHMRPYI